MLLITAATENEITPLERFRDKAKGVQILVSGMGPVATAAKLSSYLAQHGAAIDGVLNIGVAGAYVDTGIAMLDLCLAKQEFLGDFGICLEDGIQEFASDLSASVPPLVFNNDLVEKYKIILADKNIPYHVTNFVTVNCCSGTLQRGRFLRDKFQAGCENMEGAAVAMVCRNFGIQCAEIRCISNLVEDRDTAKWKLAEAIEKVCRVAGMILDAHGSAGA